MICNSVICSKVDGNCVTYFCICRISVVASNIVKWCFTKSYGLKTIVSNSEVVTIYENPFIFTISISSRSSIFSYPFMSSAAFNAKLMDC